MQHMYNCTTVLPKNLPGANSASSPGSEQENFLRETIMKRPILYTAGNDEQAPLASLIIEIHNESDLKGQRTMPNFTTPQTNISSLKRPVIFHPSFVITRAAAWLAILLLLLVACAPSTSIPQSIATPTHTLAPTATPQPTATKLPSGTVLFQADWSHGLSSWGSTHGWKVVQGQLETDTSDTPLLAIPYKPTVTDYAIEIRLRIVRLLRTNWGYFNIVAARQSGRDGYNAGVDGLEGSLSRPNGAHPQAQVYIDPYSSMAQGNAYPVDYEPGSQWHTFRVEVSGNEAILLVDGVQIGRASSQNTDLLSNGPISLVSSLVVLRVSDLRIITL
jgi:hypothetical protein